MGVSIGLDFFPARVTLPDGTIVYPARLWVADGSLLVYIVANGEPTLFYESPFVSLTGKKYAGMTITTEGGDVLAKTEHGCGCGNPLKKFNPWRGERRELVQL